jgi:hypothetical protein
MTALDSKPDRYSWPAPALRCTTAALRSYTSCSKRGSDSGCSRCCSTRAGSSSASASSTTPASAAAAVGLRSSRTSSALEPARPPLHAAGVASGSASARCFLRFMAPARSSLALAFGGVRRARRAGDWGLNVRTRTCRTSGEAFWVRGQTHRLREGHLCEGALRTVHCGRGRPAASRGRRRARARRLCGAWRAAPCARQPGRRARAPPGRAGAQRRGGGARLRPGGTARRAPPAKRWLCRPANPKASRPACAHDARARLALAATAPGRC